MKTDPQPDELEDEDEDESAETEDVRARDLWDIVRFLAPFTRPHRRPHISLPRLRLAQRSNRRRSNQSGGQDARVAEAGGSPLDCSSWCRPC